MCKPKKPKAPPPPPAPEYLRNPLLDADRNLAFLRSGRSSLRINRGGPLVANGGQPIQQLRPMVAAPQTAVASGNSFFGEALARALTGVRQRQYDSQIAATPY